VKLTVLYEGWLAKVSVDETKKAVWLERSSETARDMPAVIRELDAMRQALLGLPTAKMGLVVDTRGTLGRNDPDFEKKIFPAFHAFTQRFARVAVLVKTSAGRMQMSRLVRDNELEYRIFDDEDKARAFVGLR
jgi:hypothetical protein